MFFYDYNKILFYSLTVLPILIFLNENCYVESRAISQNYRTDDVIVTKWPTKADGESLELQEELEEKEPGWLRRQLLKFGRVASRVGNAMGSHATKLSATIDKICEVIKTIVPVLAAVCRVGQFKFCSSATEAPAELSRIMVAPNAMDMNIPD